MWFHPFAAYGLESDPKDESGWGCTANVWRPLVARAAQRHRISVFEFSFFLFFNHSGFPLLLNCCFLKKRNHDDSQHLFHVTELAALNKSHWFFKNWFLSDFEELILPRFYKTKVSKVAAFHFVWNRPRYLHEGVVCNWFLGILKGMKLLCCYCSILIMLICNYAEDSCSVASWCKFPNATKKHAISLLHTADIRWWMNLVYSKKGLCFRLKSS